MQREDFKEKEDNVQEYLDPAVSDEDIDDYDFTNYEEVEEE